MLSQVTEAGLHDDALAAGICPVLIMIAKVALLFAPRHPLPPPNRTPLVLRARFH